ncbi:MAG TPA: hypothetical protein VEC13_02310, partial [Candidatus Paceibacterota bacterium]|nr:hypothetical protein [Candidatus Paceibacterota bacterium]
MDKRLMLKAMALALSPSPTLPAKSLIYVPLVAFTLIFITGKRLMSARKDALPTFQYLSLP